MKNRILKFLSEKVALILEFLFSDFYINITSRRKIRSFDNNQIDVFQNEQQQLAIVIQGPFLSGFTCQSAIFYKRCYPRAHVIISTWNSDAEKIDIKYLEIHGIHCVFSKPPEFRGISNINMQIISTTKGLEKAKELGAKFCIKTRSDQRIYDNYFWSVLRFYHGTFLSINENTVLKGRILITSLNTFKNRVYSISDMFFYGFLDDIMLYWKVNLDTRRRSEVLIYEEDQRWSRARMCEVYLSSLFFEKLGISLDWSLKQYWELLGKYFVIINSSEIDLIWNKYTRVVGVNELMLNADKEEVKFSFWLTLPSNDLG